jgi:hypothetical protein
MLDAMKQRNQPVEDAKEKVDSYLLSLEDATGERTKHAASANKYLRFQEELALVQVWCQLGSMDAGITKPEALAMIDEYTQIDMDNRERVECSEKELRSLLIRYKDLVKVISAGSLDPQRARKATRQTRDNVFCKLDAFIRSLHAMGKVPESWKHFKDVPKTAIYNMDEVGTDTTKHRSKIIADASALIRQYQQTPEGDNKMSVHITACVTTRADGEYPADCRVSILLCNSFLTTNSDARRIP